VTHTDTTTLALSALPYSVVHVSPSSAVTLYPSNTSLVLRSASLQAPSSSSNLTYHASSLTPSTFTTTSLTSTWGIEYFIADFY
jgi:hypothetical protein